MKSLMKVIPKIGCLCFLLVWFSACGDEAGPLSGPVSTSGDVGIDSQPLSLLNGHFRFNYSAALWLALNGMFPAGLDIGEIDYGDLFADHPWLGRSDSFATVNGQKTYITDPENQMGGTLDGVLDSARAGEVVYRQCCGTGCWLPVQIDYQKKPYESKPKDRRPNLFMNVRIQNTNVPDLGATHYPGEEWGMSSVDGTVFWRLFWNNVRGFDFSADLMYLAQRFSTSNNLPTPKLTDLTRVGPAGQLFISSGDTPGIIACNDDFNYEFGSIFIGGNPFINTGGFLSPLKATWPIWVPETYDPNQPQAFKQALTTDPTSKSNRVASNYLGWALHEIQDIFVVYHAQMELGDAHDRYEAAFDVINKSLNPVYLNPILDAYRYAAGTPRFKDVLYNLKANLPELCDNFTHYFHRAWEDYTSTSVYNLASSIAGKYSTDTNAFLAKLTAQEKGLVEKEADDIVKFTIIAMACMQRPQPAKPTIPQLTSFTPDSGGTIACPNKSLAIGARCKGSYCADVAFFCANNPSLVPTTSYWTSQFSEENTNYRVCNDGEFVTGITCAGKNCDNIQLYCTKFQNAYHGSCYWTPFFSEEQAGLYLKDGYYIAGVKCDHDYCDNMSFYACQNPMLTPPTKIAPTTTSNSTPTFQWYPVSNATHYAIETSGVSKNSAIFSAVDAKCSTGLCSISPGWVMPAGTVNWHVQARNWWAGNGAFTAWSPFTVY
jgi:hypothetical protein